jgi:anti-sigma regulatory factor (Ser/Thr protein kinase)
VRERLDPDRLDEFLVMVSETVSNAVRHGKPEDDGKIGFRLELDDPVIRAVVTDGAPSFTHPTQALGTNHLGLFIVERLAHRWGRSLGGKKAIWFEVDAEAEAV